MPTPTERLLAKSKSKTCRLCTFLSEIGAKAAAEWREAINDPRFGERLIANEVNLEGEFTTRVTEAVVRNHREKRHE